MSEWSMTTNLFYTVNIFFSMYSINMEGNEWKIWERQKNCFKDISTPRVWMFSVPLSFLWVQLTLGFPVPLCYISLAIRERSQIANSIFMSIIVLFHFFRPLLCFVVAFLFLSATTTRIDHLAWIMRSVWFTKSNLFFRILTIGFILGIYYFLHIKD